MRRIILGALLALSALAAVPAPAAADEDINAWGKPDFDAGDRFKVALWRDEGGWHIRWTTAKLKRRFSGWITAPDGEFTSIVHVGKERGDWARATPRRLFFDTETERGIDGFDFHSSSAQFTFNILIDGQPVPDRVFIGKNNRNPVRMPFVLTKWESHPRGEGEPVPVPVPVPAPEPPPPPPVVVEAPASEDVNAWGKPDFERGDVLKTAIWRDDDGWHLRFTTAGHRHQFSGWVGTPDGEFTAIGFVRRERGDWARVTPSDRRLVFDTIVDGGVDGFDFRSNSAHFTFQVLIDGREMPDRVFIGKNDRNPSRMPFVLAKWESHPRGETAPVPAPPPPPPPVVAVGAEDINAWGKPDFERGDVLKTAIWRDDEGWHIRFTTAGQRHRFSGWIGTPDGEFTAVGFVRRERGDWARVAPSDRRLVFDTTVDAGVDGFDFRSNSAEFTFQVLVDGREMPERVFIGKNDRNPSRMPFMLAKWESHPRGPGRPR